MRYVFALMLTLLLILLVPSCSALLVKVEVLNQTYYESLNVLNPRDGNWIEMLPKKVELPDITFIYNGINATEYKKGDKTIRITTYGIQENQDYIVDYPFKRYPIYAEDVKAKLWVETNLKGKKAYVYVMKTYPTQLRNALDSALDGNTKPLRNLLENAIEKEVILPETITLKLTPGDYVIVSMLNKSTEANLTLISASIFQVLEHESSIEVKKMVKGGSISDIVFLDGVFIHEGSEKAKYTYIAALVSEDAYSIKFTLKSNGTKQTTNFYANNAKLVDSWKIGGVELKKINKSLIYDWIMNAFPPNSTSIEKATIQGNSFSFNLPLQNLPDGWYYLNIGAWNLTNTSQRLVAFSQEKIKVVTLPPLPPPPPRGAPMPAPSPQFPPIAEYAEGRICYAGVEQKIKIPEEFGRISDILLLSLIPEETTSISLLISLPQFIDVPELEITVYKYLEINVVTPTPVKVAGSIEFRVPKEQVDDPRRVVLMKYDDEWRELTTEYVREDAEHYYFKAELESFSLFAIAIKPLVPVPTPTPTPTTPTPTPPPTPTPTPTPPPRPEIPMLMLAILTLIVVAIALIAYFVRRR